MKAGIRFVYSSPYNYRRTKRLASKMGLETDWNCAISLREDSTSKRQRRKRAGLFKDDRHECDDEDSDDEDEHFGEGVFSDSAVRRKLINQVWGWLCLCLGLGLGLGLGGL
jgi:hypothetical protein